MKAALPLQIQATPRLYFRTLGIVLVARSSQYYRTEREWFYYRNHKRRTEYFDLFFVHMALLVPP